MKPSIAKRTLLGLAAAAAIGTPAIAGDWNYGAAPGGLKDFRGTAVPVPAPAPVPVYAPQWYFRADVGVGIGSEPSVSQRGLQYGVVDPVTGRTDTPSGHPFGLGGENFTSFFNNKDFDTRANYEIGFGRYVANGFRWDVTLGYTTTADVMMGGRYHYAEIDRFDPDPNNHGPTGNFVDGEARDKTSLSTGTLLFNAYYDMQKWGRFRPYIGAGLGLAVHEARRTHRGVEAVCGDDGGNCHAAPANIRSAYSESATGYGVAFAAAATTGLVYNFDEYTSLDLNYRYLFTGSADVGLTVNGNRSTVDIGGQHQHQIRAGLRWNIN
jgi:opacity protein-like surface antigen